jgi:hypothetical protein
MLWAIVFLFRNELGVMGILIALAISVGTLIGFLTRIVSPGWFMTIHAVLDIVLVVVLFGDVRSY